MDPREVVDDVWCIDGEMMDKGVLSVYLVADNDPTLIDAGTAKSFDTIQSGISELGMDVNDIENIVVSHVHVDHSGSVGDLLAVAPDTTVYIHESTAPHLADPERLIESSGRGLGEYFHSMGEQASVSEKRITPIPAEGMSLDIGDRTLDIEPVPGHSPDHVVMYMPESAVLFAGEAIGYYFERSDTWLPPATIPNFDVEQVTDAIETLQSLNPQHIELAHFGEWEGTSKKAFSLAEKRLAFFDERITTLFKQHEDVAATEQAVADELLDLTPAYNPMVEGLYARLLTQGYLLYYDWI